MSEYITFDQLREELRKKPDLVEVVRCRDCVRYSLDDYGNTWCAYVSSAVQPDDFCAWGERRENSHDFES